MQYPIVKIKDIADVKGGKRLPLGENLVVEKTEHPYIRGRDIRDERIKFEEPVYVTPEVHQKIKNYTVSQGDVCVTIVGNIGDVGIVPKFLDGANLTENAVKLINLRNCEPDFLRYSLLSPPTAIQMKNAAAGAAQPKLGIYKVNEIEVSLPSLPLQRRIADILSAYDNLIENNTRRIQILEEMARRIYEEWFVQFRFPGHESVKMVESELGLIPNGWKVNRLGDLCNLVMGQSPSSEFYNKTGEGLPFHQGVADFGDRFPTNRTYCSVQNRLAEAGDILFSVRAPVGRINIATEKLVIGRGLSAIRNNDGHQAFTFQQLKEKFQEEDIMGGGTIFKSVTKGDMVNLRLLNPERELLLQFENIAQPIFRSLEVLSGKNNNLRCTRDLLLPKLISGEIDVSDFPEPETL